MGRKNTNTEDDYISPEDKERLDERNKRKKEKKEQKEFTKELARLLEVWNKEKEKLERLKQELKDLQASLSAWVRWRTDSLQLMKNKAIQAGNQLIPPATAPDDYHWVKPSAVLIRQNPGGIGQIITSWYNAITAGTSRTFIGTGWTDVVNESTIEKWYDIGSQKIVDTQRAIEKKKEEIEKQKKIVKAAEDAYYAYRNSKTEGPFPEGQGEPEDTDKGGGGGGTSDVDPISNKDAKKIRYKFNIPMVKSAYYPVDSLQQSLVNNPGWTVKDNGRKMWLGKGAGKGVIQADAQYAAEWKNKEWRDFYGKRVKEQQLYGFRFLYNPMTVSMGWGIVTEVDPNVQSMGLDQSVALSPALLQSSINFSVYLNRIEDMGHIDENGWRRQAESDVNPWPTKELPSAFTEDLKEIYKRGTMYDLEFLLAAIYPANPRHMSNLNGYTSDWGWLTGYACELHIGDGLRYRVRISSLEVEHIMFNERMVPVLSEVRISTSRYPDVVQDKKYQNAVDRAAKKRKKAEEEAAKQAETGESGGKE